MAQSSSKFFSNVKMDFYSDVSIAAGTEVGWVDLRDYEGIAVAVTAHALTGAGVDVFRLVGNPASDGSGTDVTLKTHAIGSAPDAVGDTLVLEVTAEEIASLDSAGTVRYVTAYIEAANAADVAGTVYCRYGGLKQDALTADVIA